MKKLASTESNRARKSSGTRVAKAVPVKTSTAKSTGLSSAPAGARAKRTGLLTEHCSASELVSVHLRFYRPQAFEVFVAGAFNNWQPRATPLTPLIDGQWVVDLMLKPGRYEYRYVVDGQWIDDPMAPHFSANPFGDLNSVMDVQSSV